MSKGSLAVAYSMKRKKMSKGGDPYSKMEESKRPNMASGGTVKSGDPEMDYAEGGEVDIPPVSEEEAKKFKEGANFSKGGQVANSDKPIADGMKAEYDDLHLRDDLEFSDTGANSGDEKGDPRSHEKDDLVSRAMLRKKAKR